MRLVEFCSGENEIVRGVLFEPGAPPPHPALVLVHGFLQPTTPVDNLRLLMKQNTTSCARRVRVPALIARAELDRVGKLASAQRVFDAIASDKEWYEIKGSGHSFQTDCRGADAFEHIAAWLDAHLM